MFHEYISTLPEDRKEAFSKIIELLHQNLPQGFESIIQYKMPSFVVPHEIYPEGYHCDPKTPLPFISVASQKGHISLYHMGLYANPDLLDWFTQEYQKSSKSKLDMGKGCIRFKKMDDIPFELLKELFQKMSVNEWIEKYKNQLKK
jgi:uncharacterized protein YdhG (YjbR/CyaY superfamily)